MEKLEIARFERELIQDIIHKQQDIRYKNYGWSVALLIAISVASISTESKVPGILYLVLSTGIILLFGVFDITHRSDFYKVTDRSKKVEFFMREDPSSYDGPYIEETLMKKGLDYRAFQDLRFISHYGLLITICTGVFVYIQFFKTFGI